MSETPNLVMSQEDFNKISALLSGARLEIVELLEEELNRAQVVPKEQLPNDIVAMGSEVTFIDLDTNKEQTMTLVYPSESDIQTNKVSILAPVGAALIGLRIGQTIDWPLSEKKVRRIKVTAVASQYQKS